MSNRKLSPLMILGAVLAGAGLAGWFCITQAQAGSPIFGPFIGGIEENYSLPFILMIVGVGLLLLGFFTRK